MIAKMKWTTFLLSACLLAACAPLSAADGDKVPAPDNVKSKAKEGRKTDSGPEWEKRRQQMEKMTPEEREAKRQELKERLEKRISDLRAKQTNATITAQEKRELERREKVLERFELALPSGGKGARGEPKNGEAPRKREPAAPPPPEK